MASKRYISEIVGDQMKMMGQAASNGNGQQEAPAATSAEPAPQTAQPTQPQSAAATTGSSGPPIGDDDDLPF